MTWITSWRLLLRQKDHTVLDHMRSRFLETTAGLHEQFAERRVREGSRRGPQSFRDEIDIWEVIWTPYWLFEFFCDLFAVFTLGPAFVWSYFHLRHGVRQHRFRGRRHAGIRWAWHCSVLQRKSGVVRARGGDRVGQPQQRARRDERHKHGLSARRGTGSAMRKSLLKNPTRSCATSSYLVGRFFRRCMSILSFLVPNSRSSLPEVGTETAFQE
jgi:hypothetical protein